MGLLVPTAQMSVFRCQPMESISRGNSALALRLKAECVVQIACLKWDTLINTAVIFIVLCHIEYASHKLAFMQTTMTYMFNSGFYFLFNKPF